MELTKSHWLLLLAVLALTPSAAYAVPCPFTAQRVFTVTPDSGSATCYEYGNGANEMNGFSQDVIIGDPATDWTLIDTDGKDDTPAQSADNGFTVSGVTGGNFSILSSLWDEYLRIAIGFKVGGGGSTPVWAVFELFDEADSGIWSVTRQQGLSHANLYGIVDPNATEDVTAVPEPASLVLVGAGLSLLARRRMRRTKLAA